MTKFDVEELLIDNFYYFDKSTKRKSGLVKYCTFYDILKRAYTQPLTEVYLLLYQSVLQLFVKFNKFLQSEDPIIPVIWDQASSYVKKLVGKFVMVESIKKAGSDITSVDYSIKKQLQS